MKNLNLEGLFLHWVTFTLAVVNFCFCKHNIKAKQKRSGVCRILARVGGGGGTRGEMYKYREEIKHCTVRFV